jgi:cbb3-type cytochrome oxidase cytochrome c subunit
MREQWTRRIVFFIGVLILLLAIMFAYLQNPIIETDVEPERIEVGRKVYKQQTCSRCHSIAGEGNPRNPLDNVGARRSAEELRHYTVGADAVKEKLPEYLSKLKQRYRLIPIDELDALIVYLQSLRAEKTNTPP